MTTLYEIDFSKWAEKQVEFLRAEDFEKVDWAHIIEEIESLGISQQNELNSRVKVLLTHLLKWQFQSNRRSHSWEVTIGNQRIEIEDLISRNPSLRTRLAAFATSAYPVAIKLTSNETKLPRAIFPAICPYSIEQIMDEAYFPQ